VARKLVVNPFELLAATLFSSVVGSLHCVGMCSPFAMLAIGGTTANVNSSQKTLRLASYHLGRLSTYLLMGAVVALISLPMRQLAANHDFSRGIGVAIGAILIGVGTSRLFASLLDRNQSVSHSPFLERWTRGVIGLRKRLSGKSALGSSYFWGFTSTYLPCGWLYLFVLAAAAAPSAWMTLATMVAFWIGTLPLLSVSAWGLSAMSHRWQRASLCVASACIIAFGTYTMVHRTSVHVETIAAGVDHRSSMELIRNAINAKLPCCVGGSDATNP
jgi:uncharacterized protein